MSSKSNILEDMRDHMAGDTSPPVIAETPVTVIPVPQVPCPDSPLKRLESTKIILIYQSL